MNVSLYEAAAALNANSRWQEVISENLASSSIPGYKKQELAFSAVEAGMMQPGVSPQKFALPTTSVSTNFRPGELKFTGVKTDIAIEGRGFFEIQLPNGESAFTRDGEFHINNQGELVTKQGYPVLGSGGPIQIDRNNPAPLSISATGEISQGAGIRGRLRVVDFERPELLTKLSGGYFSASDSNVAPNDVDNPSLRQGFLEGANTTPVVEMANLIGVMRSFEANQRLIQVQDERMSKAISELGNPT